MVLRKADIHVQFILTYNLVIQLFPRVFLMLFHLPNNRILPCSIKMLNNPTSKPTELVEI